MSGSIAMGTGHSGQLHRARPDGLPLAQQMPMLVLSKDFERRFAQISFPRAVAWKLANFQALSLKKLRAELFKD